MRTRFALVMLAAIPAPLTAQRAGVTLLPDSAVAAIDKAFAFATGEVPGCAIGLSRAGQPVLTRAYGMANLEYGVPNTPETIFESGSVAKQFTAAALVLLAQDGKLSLDDDVRKFLPEVPDFGHTITIRHLLTHTSGLRDQWGLLSLKGSPPGSQVHTLPLILDLVAHQKQLNFEPGTDYLYSNTGYALAAMIVQRASGKSLAQFGQERLFGPLGMTSTRWRDDYARVVKNRATAYAGSAQVGFRQDMPFTNVYGNGGLLTTVGDLLKWNAMLDAPPASVGGRRFVEALETEGRLRGGRAIGYALGLGVGTERGMRVVSHSGATAGYRTMVSRYPGDSVSVAVICNGGGINAGGLASQVIAASGLVKPREQAAAQAGAPETPVSLSAEQLAEYAGVFFSPRTGTVVRTVLRDGKLTTTSPGTTTLAPVAVGRFRVPGQPGELEFSKTGRARGVELRRIVDGDTVHFLPMESAPPTPKALAEFAGSYWSPELDTRVTATVKDSVLVLRQRPATDVTLTPVFRDAFTHPQVGTLVFRRDKAGKVVGFAIWAGRVRDVRFDKERSAAR